MPIQSKPLSLERLSDSILGVFAHVPQSERLDHAVRYLSTWSGSDKLFMVVQYFVKLIIPILELRARLQYRAGLRKEPKSVGATRWANLGSIIGDSRVLWRIWGLLPIFQWMISLERTPPPTKYLQTIERLQGLSMLIYYPLEHIYYLASHSVLPPRLSPSPSTNNRIAIWSCRAWAVYVVLQFFHLKEDWKLLKLREKTLKRNLQPAEKKLDEGPGPSPEQVDIAQRKKAIWNELLVNVGYLPLTAHWSVKHGLFSEAWVGVFGMLAALCSFRGGWTATALPAPRT